MRIREATRAAAVFLALVAGADGKAPAAADPPTNVVLLMADDLGYGDVGFLGNRAIDTPHLDEMAAHALVFTRFYAAAPVCSPTRGSCLTGRHPSRYGIPLANRGHLPREEHTLAEILRARGYATGHFGKWHLGTLTVEFEDSNRGGPDGAAHFAPPWKHGFERCFSTEARVPTYDPLWRPPGPVGKHWMPLPDGAERVFFGTHYFDESGATVSENTAGDDSRVVMDRAVPFIEEAVRQGRPFFAVIWFHAPHLPVVAGAERHARYEGRGEYERSYFGAVTALDEQVGRLRRTLLELGVADRTMVWFASDNGPEGRSGKAPGSAGPLRGRKRDLYEGGVRVPAMVEWPARVAPGRTAYPAVTSDYLPTILDLLEIPGPERALDGVSLRGAMLEGATRRPAPIGFSSRRMRSWVDQRYKLISTDGGETFALYDLIRDPGERRDVSAEHPARVAAMRADLDAWMESCARSAAGADYGDAR